MDPLRELLATDHRQALEFFVLGLQDVSEPTVDRQELLYNASVLAHYAQVSTHADADVAGSRESQRGLRPFCLRHDPAARRPDDGNGGRAVPAAGGILRRSNARAAQHPLVCRARRELLQPRRGCRKHRRTKPSCSIRSPGASSRGVSATRGSAASCATSRMCSTRPATCRIRHVRQLGMRRTAIATEFGIRSHRIPNDFRNSHFLNSSHIPPMPPPIPPAAAALRRLFFSGMSQMSASVVSSNEAIDEEFCSAERTTLVGSMTPALTRSS